MKFLSFKKFNFVNFLFWGVLLYCFSFCKTLPSPQVKPRLQSNLTGWAGPPDNPTKKPFHYYYMQETGEATASSLKTGNLKLIKASCQNSAMEKSKKVFAKQMKGQIISGASVVSDGEEISSSYAEEDVVISHEVGIKECVSTNEFRECLCTVYARVTTEGID